MYAILNSIPYCCTDSLYLLLYSQPVLIAVPTAVLTAVPTAILTAVPTAVLTAAAALVVHSTQGATCLCSCILFLSSTLGRIPLLNAYSLLPHS